MDQLTLRNVSFNLSKEALDYLHGTTEGVHHFDLFYDLLSRMSMVESTGTRNGQYFTILKGQVDAPLLTLSSDWNLGRKRVRGIVKKMEELKILRRKVDKVAPLIDMICVAGWYTIEHGRDSNPCYLFARNLTRPSP